MSETEAVDTQETAELGFNDLEALMASADPETGQIDKGPETDLSPAESEPALTSSETDEDTQEAGQKLTVKDLAEKLGVDADVLYNGLTLDLGDDTSVTLGEFKDRLRDVAQADALVAEVNEQRLAVENELLAKRQAFNRYAEKLGWQPTDEDIAQAEADNKAYRELQETLAVEFMPEWSDAGAKAKDLKAIRAIQNEYGFGEVEQKAMLDARLNKLLRDYARLRDDVKGVAKLRKQPRRNQKPKGHTQIGDGVSKINAQIKSGNLTQDQAVRELGKALG